MGSETATRFPGSARYWVCGSTNTRPWRVGRVAEQLTSDDLRITDARYGTTLALDRCDDCGFRFADAAQAEPLAALYEGLTDPGYEGSQGGRAGRRARHLSRTPGSRGPFSMVPSGYVLPCPGCVVEAVARLSQL